MTLRRLINRTHLWLGLISAVPIVILSLTGTALVFEQELRALEFGKLAHVEPHGERLPLETTWKSIQAAYPEKPFNHLYLPQKPADPLLAVTAAGGSSSLLIFANPYTGEILGTRDPESGVMPVIRQLHVSLLAGPAGELVVTITSGIFLLVLGSGIFLWFKRGGGWRKLAIKWDAKGKRLLYDLHAGFGFYSSAVLLAIALSGLLIGIGTPWRNFILKATHSRWREIPQLAAPVGPGDGQPISLDKVVAVADAASPESIAVSLSVPARPDDPIHVTKRLPWGERPTLHVSVHPVTGVVTDVDDPRRYDTGHFIHRFTRAIHSAEIGGPLVRWLWLIATLVPGFLAWTGLKLWWKPRRVSKPGTGPSN